MVHYLNRFVLLAFIFSLLTFPSSASYNPQLPPSVANFGGQYNPTISPFLSCSLGDMSRCKLLYAAYNSTLDATKALQFMDGDLQYQAPPFVFTVTSANATVAATYTDASGIVFTVAATISAGTTLKMQVGTSVTAKPAASGTLTKTSGTGDATIAYASVVNGKTFYITGVECETNTAAINNGVDWLWSSVTFSNHVALGVTSASVHYYMNTTGTFSSMKFTCSNSTYAYNPIAGVNFPPGVYPGVRGDLTNPIFIKIYGVEL